MTKKEQYSLKFVKIKDSVNSDTYLCQGDFSVQGSLKLAHLLSILSNREPQYLLEEVNLALSNGDFEEYYLPDASVTDVIRIVPPNIIVNGFTITLLNLKQLLQEWIAFIES